MIQYASIAEAEAALGRGLSYAETLWYNYSATMPDYLLYYHTIGFLFAILTLLPLPIVLLELWFPHAVAPYKIQPKVNLSPADFVKWYVNVMCIFTLVIVPLQLYSYLIIKFAGVRTGLPLPSLGEMAAQIAVYFLIEDYCHYWVHRLLHGKWAYENIHRLHHELTAPIVFVAHYSHWAEVGLQGMILFFGPSIAPGHMITFWLWFILRQAEAIEVHTGFEFPLSLSKLIPFYGGAEYHDYHHYVGGQSQSNFAGIFTYLDYIYGTDKGYRYHKSYLAKLQKLDDGKKE